VVVVVVNSESGRTLRDTLPSWCDDLDRLCLVIATNVIMRECQELAMAVVKGIEQTEEDWVRDWSL